MPPPLLHRPLFNLPLRRLLSASTSTSPPPSAHSLAAGALKHSNQNLLDDAIATFRSSPSLRSLNSLLFTCILSNKHQQASQFLRDLPISYRITPNIITYNTVIKAFCQSGGSQTFYSYLNEMVRNGIKPNLTTFTISIAGFYREERFDDVKKVLWLMKKHGRRAGLSIYNVRIQSLCKLGRLDEVKELLREMRVRGTKPNCVTYDHLVLGYCCVGDLDEAKRVFAEMGRRGIVPRSSCYFSLVHYCCKGGDFGFAFGVCRESVERNWVPRFSTMKVLVDGLVSASRVREAREIVGMVKGRFSRNVELWERIEEGLPV